jgi:hypothetical protein
VKHQLVLQFAGDSLADYDALIALETRLIELLEPAHQVEGHDMGSGEMNIFIHTRAPAAAFAVAIQAIPMDTLGRSLRSAHRWLFLGRRYTVLWPPGSAEPFEVK